MRAMLLIVPVIFASIDRSDSQNQTATEIEATSAAMMRAVASRDSSAISRFLADDFILTSSETPGPLVTKQRYIGGVLDPRYLVVSHFRFHDFRLTRRGDVVIAHSRLEWRSTLQGAPWNADFLNTDTWHRNAGRWELVSRHTSYPKSDGRILR